MKILWYIIGGFFFIGIIANIFEGDDHQESHETSKQEVIIDKKGSGPLSNSSNQKISHQTEDTKIPFDAIVYSLNNRSKCLFNGIEYPLPKNAYCTDSENEAWRCLDGYKEIGDSCHKVYKNQVGDCSIKGNISFKSKEKKYRLPGSKYYDETKIDTNYGERYFCTEQEAIKAGWRIATDSEQIDDLEYILSLPVSGNQDNDIEDTDVDPYPSDSEDNYRDEDRQSDYNEIYQDPCYRFDC